MSDQPETTRFLSRKKRSNHFRGVTKMVGLGTSQITMPMP